MGPELSAGSRIPSTLRSRLLSGPVLLDSSWGLLCVPEPTIQRKLATGWLPYRRLLVKAQAIWIEVFLALGDSLPIPVDEKGLRKSLDSSQALERITTCSDDTHHYVLDPGGRYIILHDTPDGHEIGLINVYAPSNDCPDYYTVVAQAAYEYVAADILMMGDRNCVLNGKLDMTLP
ncbi:hypothetical protein NDU88_007541 [Pleurodeles waltl]|uniref:Uncharacterized protein n=1 Tax=Pleurodeles waltl TaxID=8319 RepID=A0AAV7RV32_PLEWA|nr:hypothetical protein NDU88_007541 [Pleurodeles waltl]